MLIPPLFVSAHRNAAGQLTGMDDIHGHNIQVIQDPLLSTLAVSALNNYVVKNDFNHCQLILNNPMLQFSFADFSFFFI